MQRGEDPAGNALQFPCVYNVGPGVLTSVYDPINNNTISSIATDTWIFKFPFNYPNIRNSVFINSFFNADTLAVNSIDINNLEFYNLQFNIFLYDSLNISDSKIENYNFTTIDGIGAFFVINCKVLYSVTHAGFAGGTLDNFAYLNVITNGVAFQCSGLINFDGSDGGGQVGSDIILQNSPDRFCFNGTYLVMLYGSGGITYNVGAELSIGTDTHPTGLVQQVSTALYIGVTNIGSGLPNIGPEPYGKFICRPYIADTTAGSLTYVINGFIAF